jgi:hypothetical protein
MRSPGRRAAGLLVAAALSTPSAHAEPDNDTTYGRVDGDLNLAAGLGATVGAARARGALDLRVRYLETVGLFVGYEDASLFGATPGTDPERLVRGGLEFRPLFLGRWLQGVETGIRTLDLFVDSIGLELGTFFAQARGADFARPGLLVGLGFELPIAARATGLFLGVSLAGLWSDAALAGNAVTGPSDRSLALGLRLTWHQVFGAHLVDAGDRLRP